MSHTVPQARVPRPDRCAPRPVATRGPTRPWRVGLLGAGYIADWHAAALRSVPGAVLSAVADRDVGRAEALAARAGVPQAFDSLGAMIEAGGLDAVHVLLPPDRHFEAAMTLVEAGLHVLLEKPMCVDVGQCDTLVAAAASRGVRLGIGHNFLFGEPYERLRGDLAAGLIGRPDRIVICWRKPLPQIKTGPFDQWMLRDPAHVVMEVGPHATACLLDLAAAAGLPAPMLADARASDPVELPGGARCFRRWQADFDLGPTRASLELSLGPGFAEHAAHVRGPLGAGVVDFEADTYHLRRHTPSDPDVDRYRMAAAEARSLRRQARRNLSRFALETLKLGRDGKPYGRGIAGALRAFYASLPGEADPRISPATGREVVQLCAEIGLAASRPSPTPASPSASPAPAPAARRPEPGALVVGATGFIGRHLVGRLLDRGIAVRALVRSPGRLPAELRGRPGLELVAGDATDPAAFEEAARGVGCVYHLAVAHGRTWDDYLRGDVLATQRLAEDCLRLGVRRLVYTGTIDSLYNGRAGEVITDQTPVDPHIRRRNKYARAKAAGETALMGLHRDRGLPAVVLRPGIVVGRGGNPLHLGVGRWPHGALCQLWGRGEHPLPFVLADDVAEALAAALDAPGVEGRSFNLVGPPLLTGREYVEELGRAIGARFRVEPTLAWRLWAADWARWAVKQLVRHPERPLPSYRDWDSRAHRARYDCSGARRLLGWRPVEDRDELIRLGVHAPAAEHFT